MEVLYKYMSAERVLTLLPEVGDGRSANVVRFWGKVTLTCED